MTDELGVTGMNATPKIDDITKAHDSWKFATRLHIFLGSFACVVSTLDHAAVLPVLPQIRDSHDAPLALGVDHHQS